MTKFQSDIVAFPSWRIKAQRINLQDLAATLIRLTRPQGGTRSRYFLSIFIDGVLRRDIPAAAIEPHQFLILLPGDPPAWASALEIAQRQEIVAHFGMLRSAQSTDEVRPCRLC